MYRPLAIAVLLAAVVFPPRLAGRSRAGSRPSVPFHSSIGPRIPAGHLAPRGFAVMRVRPFGGRTVFVGTFPFRHHSHFRFFFGNPCFTNPFFDPFFCREFFFNRFPFAQPVFLPYPVYTAPNYPVSEQASSIVHQRSYLAGEVERLTDEVERLRIAVEISSAIKYGFTRRIVRPQKPTDKVDDRRVTNAMASWTAWFTTLIQPLASLIQTGYAELPLATRRFSEPTTAASAHFTIIPLVSRVVQVTANSCTGAHGLRQNHVHRTRTLLYPLSSEWLRWNGTPIAWYTSCLAQTTIGIRPE